MLAISRSYLDRIVEVLLMCLFVATPARISLAQTTKGAIFGTVTDASGAVVPGASVTVTAVATGQARVVKSGADGTYVVPLLFPGQYKVRGEKTGFEPLVVGPVDVAVDARQQLDLRLALAGTQQQVTVSGKAPLIETGGAAVGQVINQKTVLDMPLNGRNFLQLVLLSAGASPLGPVSDSQSFGRPSVNISGGREASNQFTIDGVFNNVVHFEGLNLQPNIDAIEEFKVQRNTFNAEFGYGTAIVNVATRGGGNQAHFTLFEFLRNQALDARQFFDQQKPPFRQNQFGGVASGPIIKNKAFFLFSYEGFRMRRNNTLQGILPSARLLSGDFSGLPVIKDPTTNAPFTGNKIDSSRFSTITKAILPFIPPIAGGGTVNYVTAPSFANDSNQYSIRIDHHFTDKDSVFGRWTWADTNVHTPGLVPKSGNSVSDTPKNGGIQWTHTFKPNLLNEARLGFNRNLQVRVQDGANDPSLNVLATMTNVLHIPVNYGLPLIVLAGFSPFGSGPTFPEIVGGNTYQVDDSLTWVHGRHTFKTGIDFRNTQFPHTPYLMSRGQYVFQGIVTGDPVADFLLGNPFVSVGAGKGPTAFMDMKGIAAFFQDDWRATPNLTINYGLRYERLSALSDRTRGRLTVFNTRTGVLVPSNQVEAAGLVIPDNLDFGPRIGMAWRPFGNQKTVLRGGYGIYYDVKPVNEYNFGLGSEISFQLIQDTNPLAGKPPAVNWDNLFPANPGSGIGVLFNDPFSKTPRVMAYSFGVERQLPRDMMFEMMYAGQVGRRLNRRINPNQAHLPAFPGEPLNPRRPYPAFGTMIDAIDRAFSHYDSLQARLEKRFSKTLYFLAAYTWSRSSDTASNNPDNAAYAYAPERAEYGLSDFDQRQRFVFSSTWLLPFGKGQKWASSGQVVNQVFGGWQFNSIVTISSGVPFTVAAGTDRSQTDVGFQRANYIGGASGRLPGDQRSVSHWFNTAVFVPAPLGTFGNVGRNTLIGPGTQNFDLSLFKIIDVTERVKLEFRSELFNAFNKAQFNNPVADPTIPAFGQILSVRAAREIQFGLKLSY